MKAKNLLMAMALATTMSMIPSKSMAGDWDNDGDRYSYPYWFYDEYPEDDVMDAMQRCLRDYIIFNLNKYKTTDYVNTHTVFIYDGSVYDIFYTLEDYEITFSILKGKQGYASSCYFTDEQDYNYTADKVLYYMHENFNYLYTK